MHVRMHVRRLRANRQGISRACRRRAARQRGAPAKIIIDPPVAHWLAQGMVVIQYRTENPRIVQVFCPKALDVSPRIGRNSCDRG